jgi:hypothetical protein
MSAQTSGSTPKRRVRKDRRQSVAKRPLTLKVDEDAYRRLVVHASYGRTTLSALFESLVMTHLNRYRVADHAPDQTPKDEALQG